MCRERLALQGPSSDTERGWQVQRVGDGEIPEMQVLYFPRSGLVISIHDRLAGRSAFRTVRLIMIGWNGNKSGASDHWFSRTDKYRPTPVEFSVRRWPSIAIFGSTLF
jgi:hypothetical protein